MDLRASREASGLVGPRPDRLERRLSGELRLERGLLSFIAGDGAARGDLLGSWGRRLIRGVEVSMVLMMLALMSAADASPGDQVVEFARSQVGRQVGDGQCSSLAAEALRRAGARWFGHGRWGEEVKSLRDLRPGDILQFEEVVIVRQGVGEEGGITIRTFSFPHHTAIVARVRRRGTRPVLAILHQNVGSGDEAPESRKLVREWTIDLAGKRRGTIRAFRPVVRPGPAHRQSDQDDPPDEGPPDRIFPGGSKGEDPATEGKAARPHDGHLTPC